MTEITDLIEDIQDLVTDLQSLGTDLTETVGLSVIGVAGNTTAPVDAITASANGDVLQMAGGVLVWAPIAGSSIPNDTISNEMLRNSAAVSVIGRSANSIGDPADIVAGTNGHLLGRLSDAVGFAAPSSYGLPTLSGSNTFTASAAGSFLGSPAITVSANTPAIVINETDAAADNQAWYWAAGSAGTMFMGVRDDAATAATDFLTVNRTGTTVDSLALTTSSGSFSAGEISFNGVTTADIPRKSQNNTFSKSGLSVTRLLSTDNIADLFIDSDFANADERRYRIRNNGAGELQIGALNDALTVGSNFIVVTRTGTTVDSIALAATAIALNGVTTIAAGAPTLRIHETDVGADLGLWQIDSFGGSFRVTTRTDAGSVIATSLLVAHDGTSIKFNGAAPSGGHPQIICETLQLADDATGSITVPTYATIHVVSSWDTSADIIAGFSSTSVATSIYTGANAAIGTGANPDTDAKANYWKSANTTFSIKNRLGSARFFRIFVMGGE